MTLLKKRIKELEMDNQGLLSIARELNGKRRELEQKLDEAIGKFFKK